RNPKSETNSNSPITETPYRRRNMIATPIVAFEVFEHWFIRVCFGF
ncbi:MAG: hypothetical protein ACI8QF_003707, partial [Limisphaerales bacterium]